jgi:hypothetical protein
VGGGAAGPFDHTHSAAVPTNNALEKLLDVCVCGGGSASDIMGGGSLRSHSSSVWSATSPVPAPASGSTDGPFGHACAMTLALMGAWEEPLNALRPDLGGGPVMTATGDGSRGLALVHTNLSRWGRGFKVRQRWMKDDGDWLPRGHDSKRVAWR